MNGEWVLVTGGTGGIGSALVAQLAAAGWRPAVGYRSGRQAAEALAAAHDGLAVPLDLQDEGQIDAAVALLSDRPVTAVILNASAPLDVAPFGKVARDSFEHHLGVSVIGHHRLLKGLIASAFRPHKSGTVIGVLSKAMGVAGEPVLGQVASYLTAKYALWGLLKVAEAEYPWLKVRTVSPGFTDTAMLQAFGERFVELLREKNALAGPDAAAAAILEALQS